MSDDSTVRLTLCEIVKFGIIKNPTMPSFIGLIALEMLFLEFTEKGGHFEPLPVMWPIWNIQIQILHHRKPYNTPFHLSDSNENEISWICRKMAAILNYFRSRDLCEIIKIELGIIKTLVTPSFIGLIALEMMFMKFTA